VSEAAATSFFAKELALGGGGPRVALKDTIDIAGERTVAGSRALADAPAARRHAAVVQRLLDAGCRIVGKTNLHELAFGVTGINDWTGTPLNTRYPDLVPGGSSSGSAAAVAAGVADFALGTDTGGSIRIPAACCGVVGFKPTFGRVSRAGVLPAHSTLDCIGPFSSRMEWIVRAMEIIDPSFKVETSPEAVILGVVDVACEPFIADAIQKAVAVSGLKTRPVTLPSMGDAFQAGLAIINAETWSAFGYLLDTGLVANDVAARLKAGSAISQDELNRAEQARTRFRSEVDCRLDHVDVLVLPTLPVRPPKREAARQDRSAVALTTLVRPFNLSGHPAVSLPVSPAADQVAALQIVGRRGADALLLSVATRIADSLQLA
jgi:amidase